MLGKLYNSCVCRHISVLPRKNQTISESVYVDGPSGLRATGRDLSSPVGLLIAVLKKVRLAQVVLFQFR